MFGSEIDYNVIINHPINLWFAFWIMCGFYMLNYLTDMIYWEWRYNGGGDDYIRYGKKYCKNKYQKK